VRNPPSLVIWDIDGTLVHPSLESQFIAFLLDERLLSPARLVGRTLRLALRFPPPPWYKVKLAYVRGEPVDRVKEWVELWWAARGQKSVLPGAAQALSAFKERGVRQLLLSGTADFLARRLARHFELTDVIAGHAQIRDGRYTGALEAPHPHGRYKVDYASEWLSACVLNWEEVLVLGDHEGDAMLLARAGRAVAVNPRPALAREASRRGWLVVTDARLPTALLDWL